MGTNFRGRAMGALLPHGGPDPESARALLAKWFLRGRGIEIGALAAPLRLPRGARARYVDRAPTPALHEQYPELARTALVEPDILDDGQTLATIAGASQDFVIANHFIEHCEVPIRAIGNFLRVLRPGGVVYLAIPDKTRTFDRDRPVTPFSHLLEDEERGPEFSRAGHFLEWARYVDRAPDAEARARELMRRNYSIHFHVWDKPAMVAFVNSLRVEAGLSFEPALFLDNGVEGIWILRR